jgi:hypothetical protein
MEIPPDPLFWAASVFLIIAGLVGYAGMILAIRNLSRLNSKLTDSLRAMTLSITYPAAAAQLEARRLAADRQPKTPLMSSIFNTEQKRHAQARAAERLVPLQPGQFRFHNPSDEDIVPPSGGHPPQTPPQPTTEGKSA